MFVIRFLFIILFLFNLSCSNKTEKENIVLEKNLELEMIESYQEGMEALEKGDSLYAAKKFNDAETSFPQSTWAPKSSLMAAYSYYSQDYYADSIAELNRFIRLYSKNKNIDYAHYLLAICYYEQIVDEKTDLQSIITSKEKFLYIINNFPETEYAQDSKFKIELVNEILASKEMYLGRYYFDKKKWIASINRFKEIIDKYDTTIYVEEALFRLVEIYYILGLEEESIKYANLLGYNYKSSRWYEKSYSIFDKTYEKNKQKKENKQKKQNIILKKIKSLFE